MASRWPGSLDGGPGEGNGHGDVAESLWALVRGFEKRVHSGLGALRQQGKFYFSLIENTTKPL